MKSSTSTRRRRTPTASSLAENRRRGRSEPEFELLDTGVFAEDRYWDVLVEYAKASPEDVLIQITVTNRGPEAAPARPAAHRLVPQTWSWDPGAAPASPRRGRSGRPAPRSRSTDPATSRRYLYCQPDAELLFTENETNFARVFGTREPLALREGRLSRAVDPRPARRRQSRQARHQGGGASPAPGARGRQRARAAASHRPVERRRSARRRLRHRAVRSA